MSWRILYIEESDNLSLYLDNIRVKKGDNEVTIPINDINTLIIDNYKLNISIQLINKLMHNNVNVITCGISHMPESIIIPFKGHHRSSFNLFRQIEWKKEMKQLLHQLIIKNKIDNQKKLLEYLNKDLIVINKLNEYIEEVQLGDSLNREGLASKIYFRELFGPEFKRFEEDVINAGLNYGFSIIRSQITKVVISKGLNTNLGVFHIGPENSFNLCDDLIEPFRPIVECFVYKYLMHEQIFKKEHRINLIKLTTKTKVRIKDSFQTFFNGVNIFVDNLINFFDKQDSKFYDFISIKYNDI